MRRSPQRSGFSLMEVNMAVFVMAVGILSLVALFPLGLRESVQGKQDLQQSMFADYALNQLVGALSQTNITWREWAAMDRTAYPLSARVGDKTWGKTPLPAALSGKLDLSGNWTVSGKQMQNQHYRVFFALSTEASDVSLRSMSSRIMGIGVRSTDTDLSDYESYSNNVLYYAEVTFQGELR